jgi:hypothetical protein
VASGQRTKSSAIDHPALGQAVAIYDDRARTRLNLPFGLGLVVLGISGVFMGSGDLAVGNAILGWAYVGGSVFLSLWGIRGAFQAARRLRNPISLVVGRRGFEYSDGPGPISWDEVATISDPSSPAGQPRRLRVQLNDPEDYIARHALSPLSRLMLRINRDDLFLGRDTIMPVVEAESLMRRQLAEFRRAGSAPASGPASTPVRTAPRGRRPSRKR